MADGDLSQPRIRIWRKVLLQERRDLLVDAF
jgi:hypothetical protein